jgi:hypothetical protein
MHAADDAVKARRRHAQQRYQESLVGVVESLSDGRRGPAAAVPHQVAIPGR